MARPEKEGLNYFPHDADLSNDEKIQLLESTHGIIGYAIYCKLLERIYRNGYFIIANDKFIRLFSKNCNLEIEQCRNIINGCLDEGLFSDKLFKSFSILSSSGIQKRYLEACKRRKNVEMYDEYILINVNNNHENVTLIPVNEDIGTQSKVKESKGEESKEKEKDKLFDLFWLNYPNKKGKAAAKKAWSKIKDPSKVIERMKVTLPLQSQSEAWTKNNGQFIPHPATYLNQGRWEDETI